MQTPSTPRETEGLKISFKESLEEQMKRLQKMEYWTTLLLFTLQFSPSFSMLSTLGASVSNLLHLPSSTSLLVVGMSTPSLETP